MIPHYGTIVVGNGAKLGNYAVLHTSICVTAHNKTIGNGVYISTGAKLIRSFELGDNVSIAANSVVNRSFGSNILLAGTPAKIIREAQPWYERDGERFSLRVKQIEALKDKMGL